VYVKIGNNLPLQEKCGEKAPNLKISQSCARAAIAPLKKNRGVCWFACFFSLPSGRPVQRGFYPLSARGELTLGRAAPHCSVGKGRNPYTEAGAKIGTSQSECVRWPLLRGWVPQALVGPSIAIGCCYFVLYGGWANPERLGLAKNASSLCCMLCPFQRHFVPDARENLLHSKCLWTWDLGPAGTPPHEIKIRVQKGLCFEVLALKTTEMLLRFRNAP